ncbi:hypothetical protein NL676_018138 [Syzygium grande]|nr:hypothetical protein NL676_018138 [Syzygium grande]
MQGHDPVDRSAHCVLRMLCSILGGCVRGLLGSGGGFILGSHLPEIGVIPQVASATATSVMMFSVILVCGGVLHA